MDSAQQHSVILDASPWLFDIDLPLTKKLMVMIAIVRGAEKDYLSKSTPDKIRLDAKRVLFGESWFYDLCSHMGIDCIIARLHIISWRSRGKVGDPVFGFLTESRAYERYVTKQKLSLPNMESLIQGMLINGRNSRTIPHRYNKSQPGTARN